MDVYDYKRATELISAAYNCAEKISNFDNFQIDTQNGRLILEKACSPKYKSAKPFDDFTAADLSFKAALHSPRSNVRQVIKQVIKAYPRFFELYKRRLSVSEKNIILKSVNDFIEAAHSNNVAAKKRMRKSEVIPDGELNKLISLKTKILISNR